jgi:hypothetical protein
LSFEPQCRKNLEQTILYYEHQSILLVELGRDSRAQSRNRNSHRTAERRKNAALAP